MNKVYFNSQRVQPKLGTTPNMKLASIFFTTSEENIRDLLQISEHFLQTSENKRA